MARGEALNQDLKNDDSRVSWKVTNPQDNTGAQPMWSLTCIPVNVYHTLYKFKPVFRCAQARHFWVFCWVLIALILDNGKGKLKELCQYLPPKLRYWTLMRMVRSGQWDNSVCRVARRGCPLQAPTDPCLRIAAHGSSDDLTAEGRAGNPLHSQ